MVFEQSFPETTQEWQTFGVSVGSPAGELRLDEQFKRVLTEVVGAFDIVTGTQSIGYLIAVVLIAARGIYLLSGKNRKLRAVFKLFGKEIKEVAVYDLGVRIKLLHPFEQLRSVCRRNRMIESIAENKSVSEEITVLFYPFGKTLFH